MRDFIAVTLVAAATILAVSAAWAHHGWAWTTGGNIELTGIVTRAELGNPHGVLTIDADGEIWKAEVGQPWRNERAGLKDGDLAPGVEVKLIGEPSENINDRLMKVERLYLGERLYELYPERD